MTKGLDKPIHPEPGWMSGVAEYSGAEEPITTGTFWDSN